MEWAYLSDTKIELEVEAQYLVNQGYDRKAAKRALIAKYRGISQKDGFTCPTCRQKVHMVMDDPIYFRHYTEELSECVSKENRETYERQCKAEDQKIHRVGKQLIYTILEGQARIHGITVKEGYFYNKRLSIVPDFVLEFPDSEKTWAIDYITGLKTSNFYLDDILRRKMIYQSYGIEPFFFLDIKWLTVHPEDRLLSLIIPAEQEMSSVSPCDREWSQWLHEQESMIGQWHYNQTHVLSSLRPYSVSHVVYLDPHERNAHILRYLKTNSQWNLLMTFPYSIPLESALSLERNQLSFKDSSGIQIEGKEWFMERLKEIHDIVEAENERQRAEAKKLAEKERNRILWLEEENEKIKRDAMQRRASSNPNDGFSSYDNWLTKTKQIVLKQKNQQQIKQITGLLHFYEVIGISHHEDYIQALNLLEMIDWNGYIDLQSHNVLVNALQRLSAFAIPFINEYRSAGNDVPWHLTKPIKLILEKMPPSNTRLEETSFSQEQLVMPSLDKKQKEKLKRIFLSRIDGESYLNSGTVEWEGIQVALWRVIVFKHYKKFAAGRMNLQTLLQELEESGITFNQHTNLVQYPIHKMIEAIEKVVGN
ncbi:hypothetical protein [Brevibacillus choshinensis]|uniref:hypothetical protein n=1 Tax=Brevibacillus choshinensis TaxID=54911 RepID=UPI002E200200|nr:hypothetical protein [Brevibacillus choshinensis]